MRLQHTVRFVIHDGGGQYTRSFDDVFSAIGPEAITTSPGAPRANALAERWVRSVRHELLDRTIIWNERQRRALLGDYVAHYNEHRPHRSLGQRAPAGEEVAAIGCGRADPATPNLRRTHQRVPHRSLKPQDHGRASRTVGLGAPNNQSARTGAHPSERTIVPTGSRHAQGRRVGSVRWRATRRRCQPSTVSGLTIRNTSLRRRRWRAWESTARSPNRATTRRTTNGNDANTATEHPRTRHPADQDRLVSGTLRATFIHA